MVDDINAYNVLLQLDVPSWSTAASPVHYVDVQTPYQCRPETCPDGHDGLHPNSLGEYHIAGAFAGVLSSQFGVVAAPFSSPSTGPARVVTMPTNVKTVAVPEGLYTYWDPVENARGYSIRARVQGEVGWWLTSTVSHHDNYYTWISNNQTWIFQVCAHGDNAVISDWAAETSATSNLQTSPGPPNIVVQPSGDNGISLTWGAVPGFSVNRFEVIVWDRDTPGAYIQSAVVAGYGLTVTGLNINNRYPTWVATWVNLAEGNVAGGLPRSARAVIIGRGAPAVPSGIIIANSAPTTVRLTWSAVSGAAGYNIYTQRLGTTQAYVLDAVTSDNSIFIYFLVPGTWHYQYCLTAFNGNLETSITPLACVVPPVYPGYTKRDQTPAAANETLLVNSTNPDPNFGLKFDEDLQAIYTLKMENLTSVFQMT